MNIIITVVSIEGSKFKINGEFTYKSRIWNGIDIEGLLFNTRMVQGIFDDKNPETVSKWAYPDTHRWDAERNTMEFLQAMPLWKDHGVLCFTLNLQGGSPEGYSEQQPWDNTAFLEDGSLDQAYMARLERILDRADELGMVVILGYFYFGQERRLKDEASIATAVKNATEWVLQKGYRNILIEINNECNIIYTHEILKSGRVHELFGQVKEICRGRYEIPVSASFSGSAIPSDNVIEIADLILVHGNGIENPEVIEQMIKTIQKKGCYRGQPILFNEDDHFDFDRETNNLIKAIRNGASWGYFDPGSSNYIDGYQCPPVNWGINTPRKREFFDLVKRIVLD